ncbi:MAG: MotA/TolQ/ExbB proton channel family protein [Limisphaerales bacterium]
MLQLLRDGDLYIWALVATSVVALAMTLERGIALRWARIIPGQLLEELERFTRGGNPKDLERATLKHESPLGRLLRLGIENQDRPREENHDAIETRARREVSRLERGIVILEIIVGIAPLLGLVGTIHGLIALFADLGQMGLGDSSVFARGIAIALNATLLGLLVAIPSLIFWSYYSRKIETLAIEMEAACAELLEHLYPRSVPAPAARSGSAATPTPSKGR